ncbi:hypothetical protein CHISP_0696 [Chitinispirillum alkaliphilum]|nr:hypothetical protein CHISP_0696 [Chitinispirillum alkaliphilum]
MNKIVLLIIPFLLFNANAAIFDDEQSKLIDEIIPIVLNSDFDLAVRKTDSVINEQSNNILAPVLHFTALGMRDLDYNRIVDSVQFLSSFERARTSITQFEKKHGVSSYSQTLLGFTLAMHASYYLRNNSYWSAYGTGMEGIRTLQNARELDSTNVEVNFFLGLYDFGRAELRRRFWWVLFWYPGDRQSGINQLEICAQNALLTRHAALLSLVDVYLQEEQEEKSLAVIEKLISEFPESRFVHWSRAKYHEQRSEYRKAADVYGKLAQSYLNSPHGNFNGIVTLNKQAHMLNDGGYRNEAIQVCRKLLALPSCNLSNSIHRDTQRLLRRLNGN